MNHSVLTESFFYELQPFNEGRGVSDISNYVDVPDSWHVVLADIKGSTDAIKSGRYREVNMVGASAIAAVCNAWDRRYVPYVFGGDGATFLIPESRLKEILSVLKSVADMSMVEFGLELRIGAVSIRELLQSGSMIKIAKQALSPKLSQAIFSGGGLNQAESIIKKRVQVDDAALQASSANYEGLECRWQPIESSEGEILSALIRVQSLDIEESFRIYLEIIEEIEVITGGMQSANPARKNSLKVTLSARKLMTELKVRQSGMALRSKFKYFIDLMLKALFGKVAFAFGLTAADVDWPGYKKEVVQNSDFWKFDDMLRFVLDLSSAQKRALLSCLESRYSKKEIFYGIHSSKTALMTCLVFDRSGEHIHFMDGNDGGYALAAVGLKAQMEDSKSK